MAWKNLKVSGPSAAPPVAAERTPWPTRATDFDLLGHVNNASYWAPIEDALVGVDRPIAAAAIEFRGGVAGRELRVGGEERRDRDGDYRRRRDGDWNRGGDWNRNGNRDDDRRWNGRSDNDRRYDGRWEGRRDDDRRYSDNRRYDSRERWNRDWRSDRRYDWRGHRERYRSYYRPGRYYAPYRDYRYRRFSIGIHIGSPFYSNRYWIADPWYYRLPPAYGPYRWVRYYDDVLLVDIRNGYVVDVIHNFFW